MLDVLQRAELHDHLALSMFRMGDVLRSESPIGHGTDAVAQLLLDRAVIVVAEQRGADIPSLAQPRTLDVVTTALGDRRKAARDRPSWLSTDILEEDDWLRSHPSFSRDTGVNSCESLQFRRDRIHYFAGTRRRCKDGTWRLIPRFGDDHLHSSIRFVARELW